MNKVTYSIFKVFLCLHIEKIHRIIYDKYYVQNYDIKYRQKILILYYNFLFRICCDFRPYLKGLKVKLEIGHKRYQLSNIDEIVFLKLVKRKIERYKE